LIGGDDSYDASVTLLDTTQAYIVPFLDSQARGRAMAKYGGPYISNDPASKPRLNSSWIMDLVFAYPTGPI
jgi:hypothetical protein